MRRELSNFFRFQKKIWIPLLILTVAIQAWTFLAAYTQQIVMLASALLLQVLQVCAWIFLFFGILAGRVRIKKYQPGDLDYEWDDYRGNPLVIERVKAWVTYLQGEPGFEEMGGEHEPGVLMEGPPGCGKTYLAKVLASIAGVPLWSVDCQSLLGTFVGIGPLKVSGMFKGIRNEAIKSGRGAILFLDEIDSIGGRRGGVVTQYKPFTYGWFLQMMPGMGGMGGQILNVILSELDGLTEKITFTYRIRKRLAKWLGYSESHWFYPKFERPRVMVICSTNRPDILDPALTRRGRIGYHIKIDLPTVEGLKDVAAYYLDHHKHPSGVCGVVHSGLLTPDAIAKSAAGRTPADIKYILNSAIQTAHREGRKEVTLEDWMDALAEGVLGSRNPLPLDDEQRKLLATHEAGHAIVMLAVAEGRLEPMFLTTERYGRALGHMYPIEVFTWYLGWTQRMLEAAICISLAGAAAEEVIANERHNSVGGDLPNTWRLLDVMAFNGMLGKLPVGRTVITDAKQSVFADETDMNTRKQHAMDVLYSRTKNIIEENREVFDLIVPVLVKQKTLTGPEVMELIGKEVKPYVVGTD